MLAGRLFKYRTQDRAGEGNFLSYRYEKAINAKYSILVIELQPIACPGFIKTPPKGGVLFQEQRKAVPIMRPFPAYGNKPRAVNTKFRLGTLLVIWVLITGFSEESALRASSLFTRIVTAFLSIISE